jgi:hypothetical protein
VTYYVRAFAQNGERTAYGEVVTFSGECFSELPAILPATDIQATSFQANWGSRGPARPATALTSAPTPRSWAVSSPSRMPTTTASWAKGTGGTWVESNLLQSAGYVAMRTNIAQLATPAMNFNAGHSEVLAFRARIFGGGGNGDFRNRITVSVSTDNGATWTNIGTRTPLNTTLTAMEPFDLSAYAGTQVKVRLQTPAGFRRGRRRRRGCDRDQHPGSPRRVHGRLFEPDRSRDQPGGDRPAAGSDLLLPRARVRVRRLHQRQHRERVGRRPGLLLDLGRRRRLQQRATG